MTERDQATFLRISLHFLAYGASLEINLKDCVSWKFDTKYDIATKRQKDKNNRKQREWQFLGEKCYAAIFSLFFFAYDQRDGIANY